MGRPVMRRKVRKPGGVVSAYAFHRLVGEYLRSARTPDDEAAVRAAYTASVESWDDLTPGLAARWRARWGAAPVASAGTEA